MSMPELSPEEQEFVAQLYRVQYNKMLQYATTLLGDIGPAEVAVQETFVVAAQKIDDFQSSANPVGWLFNTLKYAVMQVRRDRQQAIKHCIPLEDAPELAVPQASINELDLSDNPDLRLLNRVYVEGYPLKELAAELEITVPALKMRINRAKKRQQRDPKIKNLKIFQK